MLYLSSVKRHPKPQDMIMMVVFKLMPYAKDVIKANGYLNTKLHC